MGAWCAAADVMPDEAQRHFERGLSEKEALLQAHLRSLVQVNWLFQQALQAILKFI